MNRPLILSKHFFTIYEYQTNNTAIQCVSHSWTVVYINISYNTTEQNGMMWDVTHYMHYTIVMVIKTNTN